jgi:BirA family biotin operon repressor/biotin-[acetyl-CoA-carboxylase] ligase
MNHLHFETINSTQTYLKENIENLLLTDSQILISCDEQTNGIGRTGNIWHHNKKSLAVSFTLPPHSEISLSTIELGILTQRFILRQFQENIFLKWPNDLLNSDLKKVGGIIANFYNHNLIIIGIGINFGEINFEQTHVRYDVGSIHANIDAKSLANMLYQFILDNRLSTEDILLEFNKLCPHLNKKISFYDNQQDLIGIFKGIDKEGSALIEINKQIKKFNSGSLTIL